MKSLNFRTSSIVLTFTINLFFLFCSIKIYYFSRIYHFALNQAHFLLLSSMLYLFIDHILKSDFSNLQIFLIITFYSLQYLRPYVNILGVISSLINVYNLFMCFLAFRKYNDYFKMIYFNYQRLYYPYF